MTLVKPSMGMKHLLLLRRPDAFQLGTGDADDPKVQKMIGQLGIGGGRKIPKDLQLVIAQLAFANSDLAFQGNHLFPREFLWRKYLERLESSAGRAGEFPWFAHPSRAIVGLPKTCCSCRWRCPTGVSIVIAKDFRPKGLRHLRQIQERR